MVFGYQASDDVTTPPPHWLPIGLSRRAHRSEDAGPKPTPGREATQPRLLLCRRLTDHAAQPDQTGVLRPIFVRLNSLLHLREAIWKLGNPIASSRATCSASRRWMVAIRSVPTTRRAMVLKL